MDAGIDSIGNLILRVPKAVPEAPLQSALKLFRSAALITSCFYWKRQSQWDRHLSWELPALLSVWPQVVSLVLQEPEKKDKRN